MKEVLKYVIYSMKKALVSRNKTLKALAIEYLALQPNLSAAELSDKLSIPTRTLTRWRSNPDFGEAVYKRAMVEFGLELPAVLKAAVKEAKAGNVQAQRLVLEHSGKLVKNNVNVIVSPWEMFINEKEKEQKEIKEVDFQEIPTDITANDVKLEQIKPNPRGRIKKEKEKLDNQSFKEIQKEVSRHKRNLKQKEWYNWRKRAKKIGIEPLKGRRPTPAQRKEWENKIIAAEKLSNSN